MVERLVYHVIRSPRFCQKLLARLDRLLAEVASAVEDLVDVEVNLQLAPQERPEPAEDRLPEGVLFDSLLLAVNFEAGVQIV